MKRAPIPLPPGKDYRYVHDKIMSDIKTLRRKEKKKGMLKSRRSTLQSVMLSPLNPKSPMKLHLKMMKMMKRKGKFLH